MADTVTGQRCRHCRAPIASRAVCGHCQAFSPAGHRTPLHDALFDAVRHVAVRQRDLWVGVAAGIAVFVVIAVFVFVIGVLSTGGHR